jgi:acetyltransferase (GNAT) family protein
MRREGAPVGCGALRLLDAETAELKRMYVAPTVRGTGLGRAPSASSIASTHQSRQELSVQQRASSAHSSGVELRRSVAISIYPATDRASRRSRTTLTVRLRGRPNHKASCRSRLSPILRRLFQPRAHRHHP